MVNCVVDPANVCYTNPLLKNEEFLYIYKKKEKRRRISIRLVLLHYTYTHI